MRLAHLNKLCLAGASVGALSLFLTWVEGLTSNIFYCFYEDMSVVDILGIACEFDLWLRVACLLVLVGVVLSFLTTAGAFIELAGILVFFVWYATAPESLFSGDILPGSIGPYIGTASTLMVILAMVRPMGVGYDGASVGVRQRLLTFGLSWSEADPERP